MIIKFFYNLLTSSNNHLLLQFCRCLAHALGPALAKMVVMMVTYHHPRHPPQPNFSHSSWGIKEWWKKHYASLRRIPLAPTSKTKGLNQTSIAPSRIFRTLSLRSSKRQKNRSKQTSGWIPLSKSSACWESLNPWRQSTHPISCRGQQEFGGPIICLPYLQMQMSHGINSRQHLGGIIFPRCWCAWRQLSLWSSPKGPRLL